MPPIPFSFTERVDLALSRRLERAEALANRRFVEAKRSLDPACPSTWIEVAGAYAMFDTVNSPLTQTFGLGVFEDPSDADLDRMEAFFTERGSATFHEISPLAPPSLLGRLHERGYQAIELTNLLSCPVGKHAAQVSNPDLIVRRILSNEQADYVQLAKEGWQLPEEYSAFFDEMAAVNQRNEQFAAFVVEEGGKWIGCGGLFISDDVGLIAGDATLPESRGKGAQHALILARMEYAKTLGLDLIMMAALPGSESQRNGQRAGLEIAYTRIKWFKP